MIKKIRYFWGALVIIFVIGLITIPFLFLFRKKRSYLFHKSTKIMLFLIGAKTKVNGTIDNNADVYLLNHQSIIDTIAFESIQKYDVKWVAKRELFEIPYLGKLFTLSEMIYLDRDNKKSLLKLLKDIKSSKRPIAIFPEGTRIKGQELGEFKDGISFIAYKLNLKVQPIVITNSKYIADENTKTANTGTVHLTPLKTVEAKDKEWMNNVYKDMQEVINNEYKNHNRSR